ncbi:MAG: hypothetical protein JKY37_21975 [Nannocystaceae bacterium]|nr:hypothetical protein [Nannocystaceae bacterium]
MSRFRRRYRAQCELAAAVLILFAVANLGCAECDSGPCESDCQETYPDDERARTACYVGCSDATADCASSDLEPALGQPPARKAAERPAS